MAGTSGNLRRQLAVIFEDEEPRSPVTRLFNLALAILIIVNVSRVVLESVEPIRRHFALAFDAFEQAATAIFAPNMRSASGAASILTTRAIALRSGGGCAICGASSRWSIRPRCCRPFLAFSAPAIFGCCGFCGCCGCSSSSAIRRLEYKKNGGEIVANIRAPVQSPDFAPYLQRAHDANPDGIYVFIPGNFAGIFERQYVERGLDKSASS